MLDFKSNSVLSVKKRLEVKAVVLLVTLGLIAGLVNGLIIVTESAIDQLLAVTRLFQTAIGFALFMLINITLVSFAAWLCKTLSMKAAGSGIPELKSLLANNFVSNKSDKFVSTKVLFTKTFGLIVALGSCLSIGSEGPFVHISACIAHILMKHVSVFKDILHAPHLVKQVFASAVAVGVSSNFNAPVGGILFSIEVTSIFYLVSNYWKSAIAALSGCTAYSLVLYLRNIGLQENIDDPLLLSMESSGYTKFEFIGFIIVGIAIGLGSRLYLILHQIIGIKLASFSKQQPVLTAAIVGAISATVVYFSKSYLLQGESVLNSVNEVLKPINISSREQTLTLNSLLISLFCRIFLTLIGTNVAIPCGVFMPCFLIGGIGGRVLGILVSWLCADPSSIRVASYALIGATAFTSGATQTISTAVIAVEITGNTSLLLPCLLVSVIAAGIGRHTGLSVYDQGMANKGLQTLQILLSDSMATKTAHDVMDTNVICIPDNCTSWYLMQALEYSAQHKQTTFPVLCPLNYKWNAEQEHVFTPCTTQSGPFALGADRRHKLIGYISREDIYKLLKTIVRLADKMDARIVQESAAECEQSNFNQMSEAFQRNYDLFNAMLPFDTKHDDGRDFRANMNNPMIMIHTKSIPSPDFDLESNDAWQYDEDEWENELMKEDAFSHNYCSQKVALASKSLIFSDENGSSGTIKSKANIISKIRNTISNLIGPSEPNSPFSIYLQNKICLENFSSTAVKLLSEVFPVKSKTDLNINLFPFIVGDMTPMDNIYIYFEMIKISQIFVATDGEFKGLISIEKIFQTIKDLNN